MKLTYLKPELEVIDLEPEEQLLVPVSGGTGTGSNLLDPDFTQDPFGLLI